MEQRHSRICVCTPTIPLDDLTPQGEREQRKKCHVIVPSGSLIPASFSQCELITELSETLVFKEMHFSYKSAPKHKPIAYLVLKKAAISSNSAGNTGCVSLKDRG